MRFLVDENLPVEVAELLRQAGHDAMMVLDCVQAGALDPRVAALCRDKQRALVTLDVDFGNTLLYPPGEYFGLVVLRLDSQAKPHVLTIVAALISKLAEEELLGSLWIVEEQRIRIRAGKT